MIPMALLSKIGNYQVSIGGVAITVKVIKNPCLLSGKLSELRTQLDQHRVVGIDAKAGLRNRHHFGPTGRWLVLCSGNRCLVIDLHEVSPVPDCLKSFLADQTICFVGIQMENVIKNMKDIELECKTGVSLGYFAAQVLKNPNLYKTGLEGLASAVGLQVNTDLIQSSTRVNWSTPVFTEEEMPRVICYPFYSYLVGVKVLVML